MIRRCSRTALVPLFLLFCGGAEALDSEWYVGAGVGAALFDPEPLDVAIDTISGGDTAVSGSFLFGRDFGNLSSLQLQGYALGEAELSNGQTIDYSALEAAVLYRFFDTRDLQLVPGAFGLSLYGRVGLGLINRDLGSELPLEVDSDFYFGGGIGTELYLGPVALRAEYSILDRDVQLASLGLVFRFGGRTNQGARPVIAGPGSSTVTSGPDTPTAEDTPASIDTDAETTIETPPEVVTPIPSVVEPEQPLPGDGDLDGDGVDDASDQCPDSKPGLPVRSDGCGLLNGVLTGLQFEASTATLSPSSFRQLDFLADVLVRNPEARIQLLAHTDNSGTKVEQANRTRSRIRTVATYLVSKGVSARRLTLRSLGGENPRYDNGTAEGRQANNRIEVMEAE